MHVADYHDQPAGRQRLVTTCTKRGLVGSALNGIL